MEGKKMMEMKKKGSGGGNRKEEEVMDGSDIKEMVENEEVFGRYVESKFKELDKDKDGELSVKELEPAVADIGAALGLPPLGSSPNSDHIYSEVLNEFTHGKQEKVSKTEFKEVLSDILQGMAAGLKRDPVVILRIDGEDLLDFINGPSFDSQMVSIFSLLQPDPHASLHDCFVQALANLSVDQGIPPCQDPYVKSNIVEPALKSFGGQEAEDEQKPITEETFLVEFKKFAETLAQLLKEHPVIVAHTENLFDGNGIKRLLANKFELDKTLDMAVENVPKDHNGKMGKDYLRVALDVVAPSAGLPPVGALDQMDKVVGEVMKMLDADDGKVVKEEEFKKLMKEVLGSMMLQLEGNPISISSNSVVHEPLPSTSSLLNPSS